MKQRTTKEQAEKEAQDREVSKKSALQCNDEYELSTQGGDGGEEVSTHLNSKSAPKRCLQVCEISRS